MYLVKMNKYLTARIFAYALMLQFFCISTNANESTSNISLTFFEATNSNLNENLIKEHNFNGSVTDYSEVLSDANVTVNSDNSGCDNSEDCQLQTLTTSPSVPVPSVSPKIMWNLVSSLHRGSYNSDTYSTESTSIPPGLPSSGGKPGTIHSEGLLRDYFTRSTTPPSDSFLDVVDDTSIINNELDSEVNQGGFDESPDISRENATFPPVMYKESNVIMKTPEYNSNNSSLNELYDGATSSSIPVAHSEIPNEGFSRDALLYPSETTTVKMTEDSTRHGILSDTTFAQEAEVLNSTGHLLTNAFLPNVNATGLSSEVIPNSDQNHRDSEGTTVIHHKKTLVTIIDIQRRPTEKDNAVTFSPSESVATKESFGSYAGVSFGEETEAVVTENWLTPTATTVSTINSTEIALKNEINSDDLIADGKESESSVGPDLMSTAKISEILRTGNDAASANEHSLSSALESTTELSAEIPELYMTDNDTAQVSGAVISSLSHESESSSEMSEALSTEEAEVSPSPIPKTFQILPKMSNTIPVHHSTATDIKNWTEAEVVDYNSKPYSDSAEIAPAPGLTSIRNTSHVLNVDLNAILHTTEIPRSSTDDNEIYGGLKTSILPYESDGPKSDSLFPHTEENVADSASHSLVPHDTASTVSSEIDVAMNRDNIQNFLFTTTATSAGELTEIITETATHLPELLSSPSISLGSSESDMGVTYKQHSVYNDSELLASKAYSFEENETPLATASEPTIATLLPSEIPNEENYESHVTYVTSESHSTATSISSTEDKSDVLPTFDTTPVLVINTTDEVTHISELESHFETDLFTRETVPNFTSSYDIYENRSYPATAETHREGKHIPFNTISTTNELTTSYEVPVRVVTPIPTNPETEKDRHELFYSQVAPKDLTLHERDNVISAVIELPEFLHEYLDKQVVNDMMAKTHMWLLHAIAEGYNSTINVSTTEAKYRRDVAFENLPLITYVLPTPDINFPNVSFNFLVYNASRNEILPSENVLAILNLHKEELRQLVSAENVHFFCGKLTDTYDLLSAMIENWTILMPTGIIALVMILLLICVVVYYRRKNRHSAHCLTNSKLHRNMHEAMGIDLNPAVIILQDEMQEKTVLNGNKICTVDDDEGWVAPLSDVPVAEDINAPCIQDTKL